MKGTGPARPGSFFAKITVKGAENVNKLIARLIDAGMPRDIALAVYRSFKRFNDLLGFERYVESVEEESRYQEEYGL